MLCLHVATIEAWAGFSNTGVITVAAMFVIAKCIEVSGTIDWVTRKSLGQPKNRIWAQLRFLTPTAIASIFTPDTPLVAALIPVAMSWTTRIRMSPAQFMVRLKSIMPTMLPAFTDRIMSEFRVPTEPA